MQLIALAIIIVTVVKQCIGTNSSTKNKIEYNDSANVKHIIYNSSSFSSLKSQNKQLYDSLKQYKNQIDYLAKFNYDKSYTTDKVITKKSTETSAENVNAKTFEYYSNPNDTFNYTLKINSEKEPNWYQLNVKLHDNITIVNKETEKNENHMTISSDNKADINDVTVFKKKEKKNIFNKIAIGPQIGYGYSPTSKKLEPYIGIGISYNIFGRK